MISHLPDYLKIMPFRRVANPIFSYTMELINKLARENDPDYKKELLVLPEIKKLYLIL